MSRAEQSVRLTPDAKPDPNEVPPGWAESLERSEAQLARGETLPLEPVLDRLRVTIARMESRAGVIEK